MTKTTKRTDTVAAARERLLDQPAESSEVAAFEAAIRAESGKREAALLRAIGRAVKVIRTARAWKDCDDALYTLQLAQRRATGATR